MGLTLYNGQVLLYDLTARKGASLQIVLYLAEMRVLLQGLLAFNLTGLTGILHFFLHVAHGILKFFHPFAHALHEFRNFFRAKENENKNPDHHKFLNAYTP
jgi:hypothetical protein